MKSLVILVAFAAGTLNAFGQNDVRFKRIFLQDGRAINGIQAVYKDSEGYIWLGSESFDLVRLDGRNTRVFSEELLTDYFKGQRAKLIFEDSKKNLWIGTDAGALMQFDRLKDKFILTNDSTTSVKNRLFCQVENADGSFWLGTMGGGLLRFHPSTKKFERYQSTPGDAATLPDNYVLSLVHDASGKLWIATTGGLCSFDSTTNRFARHSLTNSNPDDSYRFRVIRHMLLSGTKLYLSTYGGLQIFDLTSLKSEHFFHADEDKSSIPHSSLFRAARDQKGSIWFASYGGGLIHFDPTSRKFSSLKNDASDPESISTNNLFSCDIDRDGLLWVGGADNTLCVYDPSAKKFHRIIHRPARPEGLSVGWPHSVLHERDSIFWIGMNGSGLNRLNINTGVAKKFTNNPVDKFSLGDNKVMAIAQDREKRIWLGLAGAGLNMLDQRTGRFTRYETGGKNSISNNAVSAILVDHDNLLWAATYRNGLNIFDIRENKFKIIDDDSLEKASGVSLAYTADIFEWKGNIWFRTQNQIALFDKKKNRFVKIAEEGRSAPTNSIFIHAGPFTEEEVVIFTKSEVKTIAYSDPDHIEQKIISMRNPEDESFDSFAVDRQHQIWYVNDGGLGRWSPSTGEKRHYSQSDGIAIGDLSSIYKDKQGRMFIAGINGLTWFDPNEIRDDTVSRKILFTDFKLYNRTIGIDRVDSLTGFSLTAPVSSRQQITLDHNHDFFSVEFSALEFMAPEKIRYAYKLDGFDNNWVQVSNRNFGSYTNLDPGTYTFHVKCANPDGFWSKPLSISIVIKPPFWRTWWFIALSIALCGILINYVHNFRLAQSLKLERLRNKIASDLHDEVGSSLTRVSIYSDLLRNENSEDERANYLSRISALSREVVGTMSDIVWSIDSQSDTMDALLLRMRDFATEVLHAKNIHFDFKTTQSSKVLTDPALRQNIYLIFKEAVNNIVKHASASRVTLEIHNDSSMFRMIIADDGKGFATNDHSQGNGLRNMEKRGLAINGSVTVESNGSGTSVTFIRKTA